MIGQPEQLELGILGPLEVRVAGRPVPVPGPRQRALLAALLLRRGSGVPMDRLVDEVFGEAPPRDARNALQTYVTRLRQSLGPAAAVVAPRAPGYVLEVPGDAVDAERFAALLGQARATEAPPAAVALLDRALALWRGPAYAEFASTSARGEALRLGELRLAAEEDRAALLLRLDRLAEATASLEVIVAGEPWRERAVELLVTALAQAGRAGDALAAFAGYRDRLRDELGLDPSPKLRRLEEQVLRGTLEPVAPARPHQDRRGRPRSTSFVGRDELTLASEAIAAAPLVTLVGPGGVGKTRLAGEVADRHDAVWWVDLAPLRDPGAVPSAVADAVDLDVPPGTHLPDALGQWARRAHGLLVLDNCEHLLAAAADLAGDLLATASGLSLLATSRERLAVAGEQVLEVTPLDVPAAGAPEGGPAVRLFLDRARAADPAAIAMAHFAEGEAFADADPARASAALAEALARAREVGNRFVAGTALTALVALRARHGRPGRRRRCPCSATRSTTGEPAATAPSSSPACATSSSCWPGPAGTRRPPSSPPPCRRPRRAGPTAWRRPGSPPPWPRSMAGSAMPPTTARGRPAPPGPWRRRPTTPCASSTQTPTAPDLGVGGYRPSRAGVRDEARQVLGDRAPRAADAASLAYTTRVIKEALRLYPPVQGVGRRTGVAGVVGGYLLPAGSVVVVSPWVTHRHPRHWSDPDRLEAVIATAAVARDYRLATPPGPIPLATGITLRPAAGVPCMLTRSR